MDSPVAGHPGAASRSDPDRTPALGIAFGAEVRRKLLHMLPGLLPFVFAAFPHRDPLSPTARNIVIAAAGAITVLVLGLRRRIARAGETSWIARVLSYPATALATLLLFPAQPEFAAVVVVVLAFGDGAASLGGLARPQPVLPWNVGKSWAGFASFVICSAPVAVLAYWLEAQPAAPFSEAFACGLAAALAGAMAESLPSRINDNLRVGLAAGVAVATSAATMHAL